ncbi:hypothetical protein SAMN06265365_12275 [Tistlia consotensis]|uniref:O-Antigen ligase n=1 Tax=Tistlia consotensis USBA 355 TaxID=560819 RepID=A0A1Y6CMC1_9PROT|nr:hypothetical protein [Tistlia consotensis]SMF63126.1 hypothetical protein SAMN05428998_12475 [Tistlia consotensis USBA 355]SNR95599.1 hypothetical protein SAMN06265365_12275 [Tistlia consotensis]
MQPLLLLAGLLALPLVLFCALRWRWGFTGLLVYVPYAGMVSLQLYPAAYPLLFKDLFFAIPCMLAFFLQGRAALDRAPVPPPVTLAIALFAFIVVAQSANPGLYSLPVAIIGIKVTLMYIPLMFVAAGFSDDYRDHVRLMRIMLLVGVPACAFGLLCWGLSGVFGYVTTMKAIYGAAAEPATQGFARFDYGGTFYRINSTFTFPAQYGWFTLSMIVPSYAVAFSDPARFWRLLGKVGFYTVIAASLLSGSRSMFVFLPLLVMLILLLDGRLSGLMAGLLFAPPLALFVLDMAGLDLLKLFSGVSHLAGVYGENVAVADIFTMAGKYPLGLGTGMASIPARHVVPESVQLPVSENYFAKTIIEFGVPGLMVMLVMFATLLVACFRRFRLCAGQPTRSGAAAMLGFLTLVGVTGGKSWALDLDPVNVYFWVFAGLLLKLPYLTASAAAPQGAPQHPFLASLRRQPVLLRDQGPLRPSQHRPR